MKVVVLQSNYVPWKGYFDLIHKADLFIFYDEVQYTKNDWRNRNRIYTKNGLQWLTIPVEAHNVHKKISEVKFSSTQWQELHFKSLSLGYKAAPFFSQLNELATEYLINQKWEGLKDLNQFLIKKISGKIGINTEFRDSKDYILEGDKVNRLLNLLIQVNASEYISGPSGADYLLPYLDLFRSKGINVVFAEYPEYKPYRQLSQPFQQGVSILDIISNMSYSEIGSYIWG
ncbi:MAG: WbqC family protein [Bacteroidota bacterium]